jgi:hypothetical protein
MQDFTHQSRDSSMNRTEPPTTSRLQPTCSVLQPSPCAAPIAGRPADAANDPHMSPGAVGKSALLNKAHERLVAAESGQSSKYSRRRIADFRNRLTGAAEPGTADRLQLICAERVQVTTTERGTK